MRWAATWALLLLSVGATADATAPTYADVEFVRATETAPGVWRFDVTVSHPDTGWENYADRWRVQEAASDEPLGERILLHPHVGEQPFTRSLSNIVVPPGVELVSVGARTNLTGFLGTQVEVDLQRQQGDRFEVLRIPRESALRSGESAID